MSSSSQVEARSLAALNELAANPPQYPVNPTEQTRESLTLYISRVFGTRDVILSTFKPQRKTVTADDVANSLYYVHLDHPDDVLLVGPRHVMEDNPRSSGESSRSTTRIQRKPLPADARVGIKNQSFELLERPAAPSLATSDSFNSQRIERVRFLDVHTNTDGTRSGSSTPHVSIASPVSSVQSRPSGPRPMNIPGAARPEVPPPQLSGRERALSSSPGRRSVLSTSPGSHMSPPQDGPSLPARHYSTRPFSLTLIRRDPMSGNQWNVGKVSSYQHEDSSDQPHAPTSDHSILSHPININIETSGYAKFRGMPSKASMDAMATSASSLSRSISNLTVEEGFYRQVAMSYTKGMRAGIREKMHRRSESNSRRPWHQRQTSVGSTSSAESGGDSPPSPTVRMHPAPGYKPSGYMFKSPWDGKCEFRTGAAGSSIKCRHILPEAVATGDPDPMKQVFGPGAAQVSELRFNLPSVELFGNGKRGKIARDMHGHLSKFLKQPGDSDFEDENDWEGMDLTLGQERAGGGLKGNRSKLGKLIVHDEGMKMLDLVVAANIGLWWSAWEKRS